MRAFRDKTISLGGSCTLIEYSGQTHGFFNYRYGDDPYYRKTLVCMNEFFNGLFTPQS